jgi:hypothetical protein
MTKLLVAGSRSINGMKTVYDGISSLNLNIGEIISGHAKGVDILGEQYALLHNIPIKLFPADWDKYGKRAGYLRNIEMVKYCDEAIIFWDCESKGTLHDIEELLWIKKKMYLFTVKNNECIMTIYN